MNKNIMIEVKNMNKSFRLPTEQARGIKQATINRLKGIKGYREQKVLQDISFIVEKGDFFGIVGRNGSGKSTLLKLISGIYNPDNGSIIINGSLVSFIELGVGFNSELTGRENVYLNGSLMGFDSKQVDEMYDDIVEFAELGEFMNQKLKNYSSGMKVRLAFSCAIRAKSDILILDEILAVGDESFQRKCNEYFEKVRRDKNQTVILVTHSMNNVRKYCNKAIMIRDGELIINGSPEDIANEYSIENLVNTNKGNKNNNTEKEKSLIKNLKVKMLSPKKLEQNDKLEIEISYSVTKEMETHINVSLHDLDRNASILASSSPDTDMKKIKKIVSFDLSSINDTKFRVDVSVRDKENNVLSFLPDSMSPMAALSRTDYPDMTKKKKWALLFNRGEWREK